MAFASVRSLLILPLLAGVLLQAQVDPRLAKSKTDVLDVYFGSTSTGPNPEIISVIDNSASMATLYWSKYYWADKNESWHNNPWIAAGSDNRVVPIVYKSGSGSSVGITVSIHAAIGAGGASLSINRTALVTGGLLIMPNGNPVTYAEAGNSDDPRDWVQRASHVRFALTSNNNSTTTYSFNGTDYNVPNKNVNPRPLSTSGATADYTSASQGNVLGAGNVRVVDIPLPWGAFDAVPYYEGQNTTGVGPDGNTTPGTYVRPLLSSKLTTPVWPSGDYATAVAKKHPQHAYVYDPGLNPPTSYDAWYEVDAVWSSTGTQMYNSSGNLVNVDGVLQTNLSWSGSTPSGAYGKIGAFNYTADYLWWCFFGQDIRTQQGGVHPGGAYNGGMVDRAPGTNTGGYTVPDVREHGAGFVLYNGVAGNGLPCLTKFMAIKKALFQVYVKNEANVSWCIRFLNNDPSISSGYSSNSQSGNPGDRQLMLLNPPNSSNQPDQNSIRYIITMQALTNTPLNAALMNAYAQMADTTHTLFNTSPASCTKSFLIVLSDGAPTDTGSNPSDPYNKGMSAGNTAIQNNVNGLRGGSFYNIATIAAVAAHYPLVTANWDTYGGNPGNVPLPWAITTRGGSPAAPRHTSTLTIGVGLSGTLMDPSGTQRAMYAAALYGWEKRHDWNIDQNDTTLFNPPDPYLSTPAATSKTDNPFFFDANDPDNLAGALDAAISLTRLVTNTMGAPVAPLVGLSVGKQIYLGIFNTPDSPVWTGDLLMAGLKASGNNVQILDKLGNPTTALSRSTAVWSAADSLSSKSWKNRWLFTLKPDPANWPTGPSHPGAFTQTLLNWNESVSATDLPNSVIGVGSDQDRRSLVRFMMGASSDAQNDTASVTSITTNRPNIMGDIVNSTPAILEFPMSAIPAGSTLTSFNTAGLQNVRFRLILVGDNQGILHAFGEVSGFDSAGLLQGAVDELWGFIPPDFLVGLNAWRTGDRHIYLMDGSPIIYFNEQGTPNGVVDGTDVVRVAFGLGKGGRSTYCLTFTNNDPNQPAVAWMIRPDEKTAATTGADLAIKKMGFSTSKPAPSRIQNGSTLKDVFFIGGGLSTLDVDAAFSASTSATPPGFGSTVKLGSSILAVNVFDGTIENYWDFSSTTLGCIPAPVVPFEAIPGSFKTQRVYFSDTSGGVSVLGARASSGFRTDTSDVSLWSFRKIFTPYYSGTPVSTSPAVFYLPYGYPVVRTSDPKPIVPAVGVSFITGDRNDPMDNDTINPNNNSSPNRNRLITVLDRQDSADITGQLGKVDTYGFTDKPAASGSTPDLADLTAVSSSADTLISPVNNYLKTSYGYQLQFALGTTKPAVAGTGKFYQKGVTAPTVLNGALFFSHYTPSSTSSSLCAGSGTTNTYRMCDVLNPIYSSGGTQATSSVCSGWYVKYNDIPSELASVGLGAVIQAGEVQDENSQGKGIIQVQPVPGAPLNRILRPRAWRIIR